MKPVLLRLVVLFISLGCICGMCSKDDAGEDDNAGNAASNTVFKPEDTWVYFDESSLVYFYPNNKRPQFQKWVATKINTGISGYSGNNPHFLVWEFENTGDTRFLQNTGNPGGKETFSMSIKNFNNIPGPGTYQLDIDYKQGYCWYDVYTSSGAKHDSTRKQSISSSTFNITLMTFDKAIIPTVDRYKMSGNASFEIMYWANGTSSTSDIHTLNCTFNNVPVDFTK